MLDFWDEVFNQSCFALFIILANAGLALRAVETLSVGEVSFSAEVAVESYLSKRLGGWN